MQLMVDWQGAPDCAVRQEVWHCEHRKWLLWFSLAVLSFGLNAWDSFTFSCMFYVFSSYFFFPSFTSETSGMFRYPRTCDVGKCVSECNLTEGEDDERLLKMAKYRPKIMCQLVSHADRVDAWTPPPPTPPFSQHRVLSSFYQKSQRKFGV